ncbi:helicase C-terminal domain-containing protein [Prochlorococcus sp. MIT 1307]|uniref:helicase C-terminal domain-containing protein n=1 Tax=Prochlorococcus sp. MIT 1307 TaxID=3096219 RepID=UPI002A766C49|nr:helicase C-terminal domain-containing protein [Prochlorococcus sp. MIT 1307]
MLEASAHAQLKDILQAISCPWPHNLTLGRLVARTFRRRDNTLIQLDIGSQDFWWLGLLIPLSFDPSSAVLILSEKQRQRLLKIELPRLREKGVQLECWEGSQAPPDGQLWLMDYLGLVQAFRQESLQSKHLIIPEAEFLNERLRDVMALKITSEDWERLRRAHPSVDVALMQLHERLSRKLFAQSTRVGAHVRMDCSEIFALRDLIDSLLPSPPPWFELLQPESDHWASWAELDHKTLNWIWHLKLLDPLKHLYGLFKHQPYLLLTGTDRNDLLITQLESLASPLKVKVTLGGHLLQEPISLFAPRSQPLPNTEFYAQHLLDQSRRLILGLAGVTILLLDDDQLRRQITSELASEFGKRVIHETITPDSNGVICCRWSWWLLHQDQLPPPQQLIIAILPLSSVEEPLIAARVEALKRQGRDWFRELLLPEALSVLPQAVAPLRASHGRLAILDGRLRSRSWGEQFSRSLEPWTPLQRLLPN